MILHTVVIFLLCCHSTKGKNVQNISIESVFDQVAIPTKLTKEFLQKPMKKELPNSRTSNDNDNDNFPSSTVHYQNSNGFVPLIIPTQLNEFKEQKQNLKTFASDVVREVKVNKSKNVEDDPIFSTEARAFFNLLNPDQNRRSFNLNNNQDEFELLKVNNGTPAVANYDLFYNQSRNFLQPNSQSEIVSRKSLRNKDRERGKRIQSFLGTYDTKNEQNNHYRHTTSNKESKRNIHQTEYIQNHYKKDTTEDYRSQKATLPKTNYASITTPKSNIISISINAKKGTDSKFKTPIMVEPSAYKINLKHSEDSVKSTLTTSNTQSNMDAQIDSEILENRTSEGSSQTDETNRNYESTDSRDFSSEYTDFTDDIGKSRRTHKLNRKRPINSKLSRKLRKEQRDIYSDTFDEIEKEPLKSKSRIRQKPIPSTSDMNEEEQYEDDNSDENKSTFDNSQNFNQGNTWNQITPNIEVSHSNGFEINQIEKPKLHLVPINVISNFDHATALDNSQGFDITNAMFTGFVHKPLVSTDTPLPSSSNYFEQNLVSSTLKPSIALSTPVPDIIVGQSSFNNPVQAVLLPNQLQQNELNQYGQSTVTPAVFAVTSRPNFSASSTIDTLNLQNMLNQMQSSYPINHALQSSQSNKNLLSNIQPTTIRPVYEKFHQQLNNKLKGNNGQFLASASLSVGQGIHRHSSNDNSYSNNDRNNDNDSSESGDANSKHQITRQYLNTFSQPTIVPAILHTGIGVIQNQNQPLVQSPFFITNPSHNAHLLKATNDAIQNSMKQWQYDTQNHRYQVAGIQSTDSIGSSSNVNAINSLITPIQKAQLPILGAKNVEIINPNLNANAYAINQIPATIVTTPIPIFTTTGFIASKQPFSSTTQDPSVSANDIINSLTQIGITYPINKQKLNFNSLVHLQGSDRPLYNPINFVPNYDLIKSQSVLNSNVVPIEQFTQKNLNLVPLIPGGHFYKHSQGAQFDLANKPKLSSDLEKYAEEMFKESLRTIYNTYKWNNDPKASKNISLINTADLVKLRNELFRLKNNIRDSKGSKDILEGHYTENKIRSVEPSSDFKRPDSSSEHLYKQDYKSYSGHHQSHYHKNKPKINEYLTPPRLNSFNSKTPFLDRPLKKRPGHRTRSNLNHDYSRPHPRQGAGSNLQAANVKGTAIVDYRYPVQSDEDNYSQLDHRGSDSYNYPTFRTSSPENSQVKIASEYKLEPGEYKINHRRIHNLMGLLMKNKQLPPGIPVNSNSDNQDIGQLLDEENKRNEMKAYREALMRFQAMPGIQTQTIPQSKISAYDEIIRNFQPKTNRMGQIIPLGRISRSSYSEVN